MTIALPTAKTQFQIPNSKFPTRTATTSSTTTTTSTTTTLPPTPTITTTRFIMRTTSPSPRDTTRFATLKTTSSSSSSSLDHSCHVLRNNPDDDEVATRHHDLSSTRNNILPQDLLPCCPIVDDDPQMTTNTHASNVMTTAAIVAATNCQNPPPGHEKKNHNAKLKSLSSSRKRKSYHGEQQSRQDAKPFPKRFKWNDDATNVFCPLDRKACTLLRNENYILSFVVVVEADRSIPNHTTCNDSGDDMMLSMLRSGRLEDILFCNCQQEHQKNFLKEKVYKEAEQEEKKQQEKKEEEEEEEESRCRDTAATTTTTTRQSNAASPWNLNLIQQLTRILIDAMGFQIQDRQTKQQQQEGSNSNDHHGSSDYILQPMEDKVPLERPSSFKNLVDLQIAILKSSSSTSSSSSSSSSSSLLECRIMEDIALAYRLAAHFMLKACHEWNKQPQQEQPRPQPKRRRQKNKKNESHCRKVKTMKKIQNRAALTLFVSLRSLYVDLFLRPSSTNHTMDDEKMSFPVSKNICNFFCVKEKRTGLTPAQVLLIDCGTLLTDVEDGGVGMIDHKRCMTLVEKILKLDKEFGEMRGLDLGGEWGWGGIMELLLRQLLVTESVFVGNNNGPIQKYLEKLNQRHQAVSGALASVLLDMTPQCKIAMEEILELRRVQLDRMAEVRTIMSQQHLSSSSRVLHTLYDQSLASRDAMMSEDMHKLRMHGCLYLTKVFAVYASQHQRPNHLGGQLLRDNVEQMAFYLFHFLMENDPSSQNPEEGSVHPFSVAARVNVKSAALAALYLSTKINDCPISMRRLIALSKTVNGDFILKSFEITESDVPYQNLIKTYERHLMLLHGYDAPEMSCLPFGHTSKVEELFHLNPNEYENYLRVFQHMGYKLSSCCLLDNPLLVALAVFNFGCKYLNVLPIPCDWEDSLEETDYKIVEILSDYMNTAYKFYTERSESMFQPSNSTPELLKKDTLCSLPSLIDQIQHILGRHV